MATLFNPHIVLTEAKQSNGRLIRHAYGPYSQEEAKKVARDLNKIENVVARPLKLILNAE